MKRILFLFALTFAIFAISEAQITTVVVKNGSTTTDTIQDNVNTYFYLNGVSGTTNSTLGTNRVKATAPIKVSQIYAIQVGTVHCAVHGSGDSTRIYMEVSLDNQNWISFDATEYSGYTITTYGSGMYDYSSGYTGTLASTGGSVIKFADMSSCFPYVRFLYDNDATGHKAPYIAVVLKEF